MPLVDVIIPTWQRCKQTIEALNSVHQQTHLNIQVYVIEDGGKLLQEAVKAYPRLHYVPLEKNRGPSFARNYGASLGKAPFITFLDSDDLWQPQKIEKQLLFFANHPQYQYQHCDEVWLKNGAEVLPHKKHKKQGGFFIERAFKSCLISPSAVMFRRDFWEKHGWFAEAFRIAEDYELWLRLNFKYPIGYINEKLVVKRAGGWPQLSQTIEIDRQRVLALHRFYRLHSGETNFRAYTSPLINEAIRKCRILEKGALKYGRHKKAIQYQGWAKVFNRLRTRDIC